MWKNHEYGCTFLQNSTTKSIHMYATHLWIIYDYILFKISEVLAILHNILHVMTSHKTLGSILSKSKIKFLIIITWALSKH